MESSQKIWARIFRYFKALDTKGRLLTAISLLPTLLSISPGITGINLSPPIWFQSVWFILAFGWANFRIFESHIRSDVEIRMRQQSAKLKGGWLKVNGNQLSVDSTLFIEFSLKVDIYNHDQTPLDIKIFISNVKSNWQFDNQKFSKETKIKVHRQSVPREIAENNPFNIAGRGITEGVSIRTEIPFIVPKDEKFAYLAMLSALSIMVGFEQAGRTIVYRWIDINIVEIKESVENEIKRVVCQNQPIVHHGLAVLKEFWNAMNRKELEL